MHQDARKGMKRPLKLAAFGSGLAAETTLSNRDFERIAQHRGRPRHAMFTDERLSDGIQFFLPPLISCPLIQQ
jgi:hypothetical protein